ncbi:adenylyl cyclase X E-like [Drosophila guanche]|uniref:adenylate cyclase n=1 Tax=Drosophila guanche TaxID=7266 RepID=A0A3B0JZZ6_DROGU|nr:adenylyl cyclase X E-like [Drosophila guanche]SPP87635.1 blast:Adenylate cyclase type 8 [Drosophila guanche]
MNSPWPSFNEDVGDSRSLGNVRVLEWKHLKERCRTLQMENCVWNYMRRWATATLAHFIIVIECLMFVHITLLLTLVKNVYFYELVPYLLVLILMPLVMMVCLKDNHKECYASNMIASWVMAFLLTIMDNFVSISHGGNVVLMPSYDHIVLAAIYLYLPVAFLDRGRPYILGLAVSVVYFCCSCWRLTANKAQLLPTLVCYALYLFYQNLVLALFFTLRVFGVRRLILNRHQLVYEKIVLKMVMKNEKALLESITPAEMDQTLQEDIRTRIEDERQGKKIPKLRKLFVEPHPAVSILVADMVNYTHLTNTLDARSLVEILHELFVNYDRATKRNDAQRIKFLGNAYICVCGIPMYNPDHACSCVDLALDMISITQQVREHWMLNIDLRVGVHSGEVFAGVIGHIKWQYDIWSKDVDITNRLEMWGEPGKVHISNHTLSLLNDEFLYEEGTDSARNDPVLQKAEIYTYLVSSRHPDFMEPCFGLDSNIRGVSLASYRTSYSNIYEEVAKKTKKNMENEVKHMPAGQFIYFCRAPKREGEEPNEDQLLNAHITYGLMKFHSARMECAYMKMPDLLMKYNLVIVLVAAVGVIAMNITVSVSTMFKELLAMLLVLVLICLIGGYKKLWLQFHVTTPMGQPSFCLNRWLIWMSELIEQQTLRVGMPLSIFVILLVFVIATTGVLVCSRAEFEIELIESDVADEEPQMMCFLPWVLTQSVIIVLSLLFFFEALALSFKMGLGLFILSCHLFIIHAHYGFAFERSETINMNLKAEFAHTWYLLAYFIVLSVKQRHSTYINKAIFFTRGRYEKTRKLTEDTTKSIKIIMLNMLPSHVADNFLEIRRNDQLFYENFKNVAVMFASIENYAADRAGIRVLHEFICYFDELLVNFGRKYKIEKIKVMGWTYMAACGLSAEHYTPVRKEESELSSRSNSVRVGSNESSEPSFLMDDDEFVLIMTDFAVHLLRIMNNIQVEDIFYELDLPKSLRGCLKIGIAHGPVKAGVVGHSKPHYYIWGSTVNMASRLTSTGLQGAIQVGESTAQVLRRNNIRCSYRGQSWLEGMSNYPTYVVDLDDTLEFQYNDERSSEQDSEEEQEERTLGGSTGSDC